jgi:hypothetical protein
VRLVVAEDRMCFCSDNYVTKYDLRLVTIVNCRASKKCFDVLFRNKTVAFVKCNTL